jgi:hypothetical protein
MWYNLRDALPVIPESDRPFLVAYLNLLRYYGRQMSVQSLHGLLTQDYDFPLDLESGDRVEGVRLTRVCDDGSWPDVSPAIAMFMLNNRPLACLVLDAERQLIVDSLDGQEKPSPYGNPIAWAMYDVTDHRPPEPKAPPQLYTHNVVDGIDITSYGRPKKMYVKNPDGAPLMNFGGQIDTFRDFRPVPGKPLPYGYPVRIMGIAHHPVKPNGIDFLIPMHPFDAWGMFSRTGNLAAYTGLKLGDLSDTRPPELPRVTRDVVSQVARQKVETPDLGQALRDSFRYLRDDHEPVPYQVMRKFGSYSYLKLTAEPIVMQPGTLQKPRIIRILGTFWVDGEPYLLPLLSNDTDPFEWFYGVMEEVNGMRVIEKLPDSTDVPEDEDDAALKVLAERVRRQHPSVLDYLDSISSLIEVTAIRGVLKLKRHVERITTWK